MITLNDIYIKEEKKFIKILSYIRRNYLDSNFFNIFFKKDINKILYLNNKICIVFFKKESLISFNKFLSEKYSINSNANIKNKELFIENFKFEKGNKKLIYILKIIYEDYNKKIKFHLQRYKKNIKKLNKNKNIINNENIKITNLYKKFYNNANIFYNKKVKELSL